MNFNEKTLVLQLFAEGGEGAGETGDELGNDADCREDESFESLIDGKYKEAFSKRTQEIIDKRFKETKQLENYRDRVKPLISKMCEQYGLSADDTDGLVLKMQEKSGDGDENEREQEYLGRREQLKNTVEGWLKQGDSLKETYPDFDLREELKRNETFGLLLKNGVPVKTAFEVVHKDEILSGAMAYTAEMVRRSVVQGLESKHNRPVENGMNSGSGVVTRVNVNALTSQDILKIIKQVENGVEVKF